MIAFLTGSTLLCPALCPLPFCPALPYEDAPSMIYFLTGATGFIGGAVARHWWPPAIACARSSARLPRREI